MTGKQVSLSSLQKPARLQVDLDSIPDDDKPPQTGSTFNIWFLKWSGGDSSRKNYIKLNFRVHIDKDAGYTKGGSKSPICLFFARGCCYRGKKCPYLHRLPIETDYFIPTQDCFGRDKTSEYRDDMDGVGSFNRVNTTLYVGGLQISNNKKDNIENVLTKHFQEFGSIEQIKVLYGKSCAFVTYKLESSAQFAKEAMQNQSLDANEILNIRWANEDPDVEAQLKRKRNLQDITINTIQEILKTTSKKPKISDSSEPITNYDVEETEEEEPEPEQEPEQLALPEPEELKAIFDNADTDIMKKFGQLQSAKQKELQNANMSNLLGGYSSDED